MGASRSRAQSFDEADVAVEYDSDEYEYGPDDHNHRVGVLIGPARAGKTCFLEVASRLKDNGPVAGRPYCGTVGQHYLPLEAEFADFPGQPLHLWDFGYVPMGAPDVYRERVSGGILRDSTVMAVVFDLSDRWSLEKAMEIGMRAREDRRRRFQAAVALLGCKSDLERQVSAVEGRLQAARLHPRAAYVECTATQRASVMAAVRAVVRTASREWRERLEVRWAVVSGARVSAGSGAGEPWARFLASGAPARVMREVVGFL